eukprot:6133783-Pyramimonas_sp.AAC.1
MGIIVPCAGARGVVRAVVAPLRAPAMPRRGRGASGRHLPAAGGAAGGASQPRRRPSLTPLGITIGE